MGAEEPTSTEFMTKDKMRMLASGSDWRGMNDASRHMQHYLENTGEPLDLPVDNMLHDDEGLRIHAEEAIRGKQDAWREQALEEYRRNGGRPVTISVETGSSDYSLSGSTPSTARVWCGCRRRGRGWYPTGPWGRTLAWSVGR
jgi:hypothetical protein